MTASDEVTKIDRDGTGIIRAALRRRPTLQWTDRKGTHSVQLEGRKVLGSASDAEVSIADAAVSRLHATLEPRDDGVWIQDLGSKNGTFIDAIRIVHARIQDQGQLRVGRTVLRVQYEPAAARIELWPTESFGPLLGRSLAMRELFSRLQKIASTDVTVLVHGETGTGKELVAQAIHDASSRKAQPFVIVDCAALTESLLEAELFGHSKGAFTGAVGARAGAFECADGGTLFLDEIGELPLAFQPKLLRALESRSVRRIGENHYRKVDVRIVAATHRDLPKMVNEGAFREDLYFRLAVIPVSVPPLRQRREDIELLARAFSTRLGLALPTELQAAMTAAPWLGNVRELRNFVDRTMVLGVAEALRQLSQSHAVQAIESANLPATVGHEKKSVSETNETFPTVNPDEPFKEIRDRWTNHLEREYIRLLLEKHKGNVSAAAQAAMLDRSYIHRLIRKHEL